jgi:hypothetical protein
MDESQLLMHSFDLDPYAKGQHILVEICGFIEGYPFHLYRFIHGGARGT